MDVVCFPRLDIPREGGAVVPLADAVQQVDLDLARAMLHAKARPMGFPRQAVATDGNGFGLTARISRFLHLPLVATGFARSAPLRLHASVSVLATRPDGYPQYRVANRTALSHPLVLD